MEMNKPSCSWKKWPKDHKRAKDDRRASEEKLDPLQEGYLGSVSMHLHAGVNKHRESVYYKETEKDQDGNDVVCGFFKWHHDCLDYQYHNEEYLQGKVEVGYVWNCNEQQVNDKTVRKVQPGKVAMLITEAALKGIKHRLEFPSKKSPELHPVKKVVFGEKTLTFHQERVTE